MTTTCAAEKAALWYARTAKPLASAMRPAHSLGERRMRLVWRDLWCAIRSSALTFAAGRAAIAIAIFIAVTIDGTARLKLCKYAAEDPYVGSRKATERGLHLGCANAVGFHCIDYALNACGDEWCIREALIVLVCWRRRAAWRTFPST